VTILESSTIEDLGKKLSDPAFQDQIDFDIELIVAENSQGSALMGLKKIEPAVRQAKLSQDLIKKYTGALTQLKFIALPKLKQEEAFSLISTGLLYVLNTGYDVSQKMRQLFTFADPTNFKTVDWLLRSIEANNELLAGNITFVDGKQYAGTIGNLIRLYKNSSNFKQGGSLGISNFLANEKQIKQFEGKKIELLRDILSIYDWIRLKAINRGEENLNSFPEVNNDFLSTPQPESYGLSFARPQAAPEFTPATPATRIVSKSKPLAFQAEGPVATSNVIPGAQEKTAFEKRLAEISVATPASKTSEKHGVDLESLKHRVEEQKIQEVIKAPPSVPKASGGIAMTPQEIKREVSTRELPAHQAPKLEVPKAVIPPAAKPTPAPVPPLVIKPVVPSPLIKPVPPPAPAPMPKPVMPVKKPIASSPKPVGKVTLKSLEDIRTLEDLKKIELGNLRQGAVENQVEIIKSKILDLSRTSKTLPYYLVVALEQSPLFKSYLAHGSAIVEGRLSETDLTQEEFEAVADLRRQVESL